MLQRPCGWPLVLGRGPMNVPANAVDPGFSGPWCSTATPSVFWWPKGAGILSYMWDLSASWYSLPVLQSRKRIRVSRDVPIDGG